MILEVVVTLVALAAGAAIGVYLQRARANSLLQQASEEATKIREESRKSLGLTQREYGSRAREQALEIAQAAEVELEAYAQECALISERLGKRAGRLKRRGDVQGERKAALEERVQAVREKRNAAQKTRHEAKDLRRSELGILEEQCATTRETLCSQLAQALVEETRSRCEDHLRNLDSAEAAELDRRAHQLLGIATQRYVGYCPRERSGTIIPLDAAGVERLQADNERFLSALRSHASVDIHFTEEGTNLRVDTGDGVLREVCRRAVKRFLGKDGAIDDVQALVERIRADLAAEIARHGKAAFSALGLKVAGDAVCELLGQLNWRTSYTQNQYRHSIEAAHLSALIAAELGLDARVAARGTLLHDIGKALTHSAEGSHALLGAEVAAQSGEPPLVVNAIAAHHGEVPMESAFAWLATAADAMSGGRPGARREMTEAYGDRIGDLERLAADFRGVQSAHAVQAGREIRVLVDEGEVGENRLGELSDKIAECISTEMVFPGQIRVTVIREFRAIAEAR